MKGISGNPALDAYKSMAVKPISSANPSAPTEAAPARNANQGAAKVSISAEARSLASGGEVNHQKVEALKTAITSGTFKVNSREVAERMLG